MSDGQWKVQQYCYFWIASKVVTAAEITALLGIEADRVGVRGSKRESPSVVPVEHSWELRCERHAPIDEQASDVLDRIRPVAAKVRALTDREDIDARDQRHDDPPDADGRGASRMRPARDIRGSVPRS